MAHWWGGPAHPERHRVPSAFSLLGANENDLTSALGFASSKCPPLAAALTQRIYAATGTCAQGDLSRHRRALGFQRGKYDDRSIGATRHLDRNVGLRFRGIDVFAQFA